VNATSTRLITVVARTACLVATCALPVLGASDSADAEQTPSCLVATASGNVQGLLRGGTCTYLGVPYAAPPVGNLRWRPPQPRAPWAPATLNTTAATVCAQSGAGVGGAPSGTEDCLTLNIWTPAGAASGSQLPVIVWLHTGNFSAANANQPATDGQRFAAERGAIIVAPNYRLGVFGFLAHAALTMEDAGYPASGNYGFADQRAALRWVRDHIASFGGNPANVTLAGQSAGGVSTSLHLVSPASRGLFHRAIMQSGQASTRWRSAAEAEMQGDAFAAAVGCTNPQTVLACMRSASQDQVLRALPRGSQQFSEEPGLVLWGPVVDGLEVPDQPRELYRRGLFSRIPIIIGAVGDEGWAYADRSFPSGLDALQYERAVRAEFGMDADAILRVYPATAFPTPKDALARLIADVEVVCESRRVVRVMHHDGAPVYVYSFEYTVDAVNRGRAVHGLEPNLLFGNNYGAPTPHVLSAGDLAIFDAMSTYWRRFAETGDPNPRGQPVQWPPYRPGPFEGARDPSRSDSYFVFGERLGVNTYLRDSQCNFWESFYFRSALGTVPAVAR